MLNRHRISISLAISVLLSLLLLFFVLFSVYTTRIHISNFRSQSVLVGNLNDMHGFKESIIRGHDAFCSYMESGNMYKKKAFNTHMEKASECMEHIFQNMGSGDTGYLVSSLKLSFSNYSKFTGKILENPRNPRSYHIYDKAEVDRMVTYMTLYSDQVLAMTIVDDTDRLNEMAESNRVVVDMSMAYLGLFILSIILILLLFYYKLRKPLRRLGETAALIGEGDFDVENGIRTGDKEVVLLSETLDSMTRSIRTLRMEEKKKYEMEERLSRERQRNMEIEAALDKATFIALQTQTNPHFLYNTLNSIRRTVRLGKTESAEKMLISLSKLMRYNLSDGNEPAVLREEVEITEEYLGIQKMRFGERINYRVDISDEFMESVLIPRFTLQPLVENAIIHGLEPLESGGTVSISVTSEDGNVYLTVSDDGMGASPEKIEKLNSRDGKKERIGLDNTRRRLELFLEREDVLSVDSPEGKGFVVRIDLGKEISYV